MSEEEFTFEEDKEENNLENIPDYGSEKWEEFVMRQFLPNELYEGSYPTLNGMRRVALLMLGDIVLSGPSMVISNLPNSSYCIYELEFDNGRTFKAAADAHQENIQGSYSIYTTAIAESRAEARAYRKALLISTVSAEEVKGNEKAFHSVIESKLDNKVSEYDETGKASSQQLALIKTKCSQQKVDMDKFLESEGKNTESLTKSEAIELMKKLSSFEKSGVPKEIK